MQDNIIQLRNHHLKQGKNNDRTPIYPLVKPEGIRGLKAYLEKESIGGGVTKVDTLPEQGEEGKIYYNTTTGTYYVWDVKNSAFTPLGVYETVVITNIDDVEQAKEELIPGTQSVIANGYVLEPNIFYNIENWQKDMTFDGIAFKFDATDNNVYAGRFTAWADNMSIGLPAGVSLPDETIDIVEGHTYEFNIWQGVCIIQDVTVTSAISNG